MSNIQDEAVMQEIMILGKLLHQNGEKVLNASGKLCLSASLLYNLNEAFSLVVNGCEDLEASFQVCNSSKIDIFHDLKFLHDFVQKTIGLKVTYCSTNPKIPVDITKFKCLKYLELKKINIDTVEGLRHVRGQLESIVCAGRKGVSHLKQLLANCGGDTGIGFVWSSLKHLALPHNALEKLDTSLELVPWLQVIDLSHNLITSADELSCLPNLKHINLGYNKLERVPTFNEAASRLLQVLVLKNNYIENLDGMQNLECLTELDLSYNCLMEHSVLWSLEKMSVLLWVSLEGNPLSYHPKHRLLSIKHLHPALSNSKFVLDHSSFSRIEKQIIADNRFFMIRSEKSAKELLNSVSNSLNSSSFSTSVNTSTINEFVAGTPERRDSIEKNLPKSKKRSNIKEAVIADVEHEEKDVKADLSISYLETSESHLETKKQILEIRRRYGEDKWLSSQAGTFVQDIMGLQPPTYSATSEFMIEGATNMPSIEDSASLLMKDTQSLTEATSEFNHENEDETKVLTEEENISEVVLNNDVNALENLSKPAYDPEQEVGNVYLVQKKKNSSELEDLFLVITPK
ncbi:Serine/threonine-protein kinase 11-interacting protein [Melipona quadrifasciata]|uniref:Serine/threonine-protein kinase 11-interacting protein n=1 Tax=Melipona quadrifasciata TaxID=166423 RepID=A0A0N0BCG2_9HYME|nr:Serine/threonine-protein kinase 11-interacting protein [Melipona quadrifasciata]